MKVTAAVVFCVGLFPIYLYLTSTEDDSNKGILKAMGFFVLDVVIAVLVDMIPNLR